MQNNGRLYHCRTSRHAHSWSGHITRLLLAYPPRERATRNKLRIFRAVHNLKKEGLAEKFGGAVTRHTIIAIRTSTANHRLALLSRCPTCSVYQYRTFSAMKKRSARNRICETVVPCTCPGYIQGMAGMPEHDLSVFPIVLHPRVRNNGAKDRSFWGYA